MISIIEDATDSLLKMQLMQLWKQSFLDFLFIAAYTINVSWIINCDGRLYIVHAHYFFFY